MKAEIPDVFRRNSLDSRASQRISPYGQMLIGVGGIDDPEKRQQLRTLGMTEVDALTLSDAE